jgi:hypothetical protein
VVSETKFVAERDGFEPSVWASAPSASEALPYLTNALAGLKLERSDDRRSRLRLPSRRQNRKVLARLVESGGFARGRLITTDDHIDIERVEFEPAANTRNRFLRIASPTSRRSCVGALAGIR